MKKIIFIWFPFVFLLSVFSLVIFTVTQQSIRQAANDPQIQIAHDTANYLVSTGADPKTLVGTVGVDLKDGLATFGIIYDAEGVPLAAGAKLNEKTPVPPAGVFEYTKTHGEDRFTWEPEKGVRHAVVMKTSGGGDTPLRFVLIGRSLREIEAREKSVGIMVLSAWIGSLVLTLLYSVLIAKAHKHF